MNNERTIALLGQATMTRLEQARVILFGVGGVGGWCAEALVRTGIAHLTIVDCDVVNTSNINRQVVALANNVGEAKVEEMKKRLLAINPQADIVAIHQKYIPQTAGELTHPAFDFNQYDYVIDAIDSLDCKADLIYRATQSSATLFSSMGAARKMDVSQIKTAEFWKVNGCPLARALRTRLKKEKKLPAKKFQCVYSPELSADSGTIAPVVGVFGFMLAGLVIEDVMKK